VSDILIVKLNRAIKELYKNNTKNTSVSIVGGVANNNYIKNYLKNIKEKETIEFVYPAKYMMNDNAAMIAWATILKYKKYHDLNFKPNPRLTV
jgi:tRNA A37 threonylcarbamoyltransferase TsaD